MAVYLSRRSLRLILIIAVLTITPLIILQLLPRGCRQQIQEPAARMKQGTEQFKVACKGDVEQFCRNIDIAEGRIVRCLLDHDTQLSLPCRAVLGKPAGNGR
jgi:hypothetical protein